MTEFLPISRAIALPMSIFVLIIALSSVRKLGRAQRLSAFRGRPDKGRIVFIPWIQKALWYPVSSIKCRALAWLFLIRGPDIVQDAYYKSKGAPFLVDVPENRYLVVSSWDQIKEIDKAPDDVLSLQAAAKEILQPKYSMHGFNWFDQRGLEGTPLIRTLRTLLTNHLPIVLPELRYLMSAILDEHHESAVVRNGVRQARLFPMVLECVLASNGTAFFGKDIANNKMFMKAAKEFIEFTLLIAEVVRLLPSTIAPIVGKFLAGRLKAQKIMSEVLLPTVQQRLDERDCAKFGHEVPRHNDCIQWVMQSSPKSKPWSAQRIVHELMALWFGSVHITSTTACFTLHDLCLHPEYIEPLRKEIISTGWTKFEDSRGQGLPLLDSFIKESARKNPVEAISTRRMALKTFQLSDGTTIEPGGWVCTAARAMASDPAHFARPQEFHGFRFVDRRHLGTVNHAHGADHARPPPGTASGLTEVADWQLWGTGRCACPGRYYAAALMKTMLALFITKYDMALTDPNASRYFTWRSFIYPWEGTTVNLHPTSPL